MTRHKTLGFTLIEIVIVIVLLGMLSAIALPRFLDLSMDAKHAANQQVAASLNAALNNYKMQAQLPVGPTDPIQPTSRAFSLSFNGLMRAVDVQQNNPNGTGTVLFFAAKTKLIGGATSVPRVGGRLIVEDADPANASDGGNLANLTTHTVNNSSYNCYAIFNILLGKGNIYSVLAPYSGGPPVPSGSAALGGAKADVAAPYQCFQADGSTGPVISTSPIGFTPTTPKYATLFPNPPSHYGGCLWIRTDTMTSPSFLYIFYDISKEVFISVEAAS